MPDLLAVKFGLAFDLRRRGASRTEDFEDKPSPEWGNLKPESCEFSLRAKSLNEAYKLLQKLGLSPVLPKSREVHLASGGPFTSQVEGLVAKVSGAYYVREPWQVTVAIGAGEHLTWELIKTASSHLPPNLKDGQNVSRLPLVGPLTSYQVAMEFSSHQPLIGNVVKTRRRKKTTETKQKLLQDPKLFRVCRSRGENAKRGKQQDRESLDHDQGDTVGVQLGREESKEEKRKRKMTRKREKEKARKEKKAEKEDQQKICQEVDVDLKVKKGNKKYAQLQAFVEKRRQKKQKRDVREESAFQEEKTDEKISLDLNSKVFTHI